MTNLTVCVDSLELDGLGRVVLSDADMEELSRLPDLMMSGGYPNASCSNSVSCGGTSNGSCSNQLDCQYSSNGRCV